MKQTKECVQYMRVCSNVHRFVVMGGGGWGGTGVGSGKGKEREEGEAVEYY